MATIEGAVQSLDDSMDKLRSRFRGSEEQAVRLFRTRLEIDETTARIALAADPDAAVGPALTLDILHLSADVSLVPGDGGPPFDEVMTRTGTTLGEVLARLPAPPATALPPA